MKQTRFARIAEIAGADDWYDKWGTAMNLFFDIAEVLDMTDIEGDVTPSPFAQANPPQFPAFRTRREAAQALADGNFNY